MTDAVVLGAAPEVLADDVGAHLLDERGAGGVDRLEGDGVGCGRSRCGFSLIGMGRVCPGPPCWQDVAMDGGDRRQDDPRRRRPRRRRRAGRRWPARPGAASRGPARRPGAGASYTFRQARRASRAEGAGDSGLYRLIELHAFNAAGDAAVAISLAGTLFFAQPGEARGQVALFLGPDDAAVRGRRSAARAVPRPVQPRSPVGDRRDDGAACVPVLADGRRRRLAVGRSCTRPPSGVLVASKAYGVARAATVPRLLPPG